MIKKVIAISTTIFLLSGCVTTADGDKRVSRAVTYGLSGAGIGATLGAIFGDSSKKTKNSAIAGGVIGTAIGAIMDIQEAKLKKATAGTGFEVERVADNKIRLTMPENITFDTNQYHLKTKSVAILNEIVPILKENANQQRIQITGHADSTGNDAINDPLSTQRAYAVQEYLAREGIVNLSANGVGSRQPIDSNDTAVGRQKNRRVEVELIGSQQAAKQS